MRKKCTTLAVLAFFLLLFYYNASADSPAATARYITGEELQQMMKDGKKLAIIDIRDRSYCSKGHIPGAICVPTDVAYNRRPIVEEYQPKDRVVIVGYGGTTGQEIIDMFLSHGFENVYGLKGGMREWKGPIAK